MTEAPDETKNTEAQPLQEPVTHTFDLSAQQPRQHSWVQRGNMMYCDGSSCGARHAVPISSPRRTLVSDGKGGMSFTDD